MRNILVLDVEQFSKVKQGISRTLSARKFEKEGRLREWGNAHLVDRKGFRPVFGCVCMRSTDFTVPFLLYVLTVVISLASKKPSATSNRNVV